MICHLPKLGEEREGMLNPRKDILCVLESRVGSALCFLCVFNDGKNDTIFIFSGIILFFCEYSMLGFSPLCRILKVLYFESSQKFGSFL